MGRPEKPLGAVDGARAECARALRSLRSNTRTPPPTYRELEAMTRRRAHERGPGERPYTASALSQAAGGGNRRSGEPIGCG